MFKQFALMAGTVVTAVALSSGAPALADSKAENAQLAMSHGDHGVVIKRRTLFRCISNGMKGLKKKKGDANKHVALIKKNVSMLSSELKALFPKGSDMGATRAKGDIWKDWDKFAKAAAGLGKATDGLAKTVASGGDTKAALKAMGKACGSCHKPFRSKDKVKPKVKCG